MKFRPLRTLRRVYRDFIARPLKGLLRFLSPVKLIRRTFKSLWALIRRIQGKATTGRPRRKWLHLLVGIPAVLLAIFAMAVSVKAGVNQRGLGQEYWRRGLAAIGRDDYRAAQLHLMRASAARDVDSREVDFALAVVWERLGFAGRSMQTFQNLAPTNRPGFPKAHRHLAMLINRDIRQRDNELMTRWFWHLTHSDEQKSAELQQVWGNYYLAMDDIRAAINAYSQAASKYPQLFLTISSLYERLGQVELRMSTLRLSRDRYAELVTKDPNDRNSRVVFATTLLQLGELTEAERVLRTGLRIDPDGPYKLLLAAMFVQLHDKLKERGADYEVLAVQQLRNSLEFDPNFEPALTRLLGFAKVNEAAIPQIRDMLNKLLVSGEGTAVAHITLSNLAWLEKKPEVAAIHLQQAMSLDNKMPVIANNLAWLLAHDKDDPKLDRALEIVEAVVKDNPDNSRFLDTRGTILAKLGRDRDALVDLEKALPGMPDRAPVHGKLAEIYDRLQMKEIAEGHRKLSLTKVADRSVGQ
ncbi:MAG TPA: hypothetical protein DDZ51_21130 [Planctomycetaceae bacterium]|nr:hypothetical protein [Planctomycetaceae bacterium]